MKLAALGPKMTHPALTLVTLAAWAAGCGAGVSDSSGAVGGAADVGDDADAVEVTGDADEGCEVDDDCQAASSPCRSGVCTAGRCESVAIDEGLPCDDGDRCTRATVCAAGVCGGGTAPVCDDDNPCTLDGCDPLTGCEHVPGEADHACDDGDPCTAADRCDAAGACFGDLRQECECAADEDCAPHDDANLCNGRLRCVEGFCALDRESIVRCPEAGACRSAVCHPPTGTCETQLLADRAPCDDRNPCTTEDACQGGVCVGVGGSCACATHEDCKAVQGPDYDLCLGTLACVDGRCAPDPDRRITCPAGPGPCQVSACVRSTGLCETTSAPDGVTCARDDGCAPVGRCTFGACLATGPACDDGDPCTEDRCVDGAACEHAPHDGACDDADPCTADDACREGRCVGAGPTACDDGNPCTVDACDPALGCTHAAEDDGTSCDDDDLCTTSGHCEGGLCLGRASVVCASAGPCVASWCEPSSGCLEEPRADGTTCEDDDPCTQAGHCAGGTCATLPIPCSDGLPCTEDRCEPGVGCVSEARPDGASCKPGAPCLVGGACQDGACVGGVERPCDDGACVTRACDPATGTCVQAGARPDGTPCQDEDACRDAGECRGGACMAEPRVDCDDGDACTVDACLADTGACEHEPLDCSPDTADPCRVWSCDPEVGCVSTPVEPCAAPATVFESDLPCADADRWSVEVLAGEVGFAVDGDPDPPGAWSPPCSLNLNDGSSFASADGPTRAAALSPPIDAPKPGVTAGPTVLVMVRFYEWLDVDERPDADWRYVGLVDAAGGAITEAELLKQPAALRTWTPREVALTATGLSRFQVRLRFDSVDGVDNGGAGWFIDDLSVEVVPAP